MAITMENLPAAEGGFEVTREMIEQWCAAYGLELVDLYPAATVHPGCCSDPFPFIEQHASKTNGGLHSS